MRIFIYRILLLALAFLLVPAVPVVALSTGPIELPLDAAEKPSGFSTFNDPVTGITYEAAKEKSFGLGVVFSGAFQLRRPPAGIGSNFKGTSQAESPSGFAVLTNWSRIAFLWATVETTCMSQPLVSPLIPRPERRLPAFVTPCWISL